MWKNIPDPWELRLMFPEEARLLEDVYLLDELQSLGISFSKLKLKKSTTFKIALNDPYELWVSPVDIGPCGQTEWFTWHKPNHRNPDQQNSFNLPEYQMHIRACIQLIRKDDQKNVVFHSFTNAQDSIEDLLRSSLMCIHRDIALQLTPVIKSARLRSVRKRD